jgi:hypothetical protein
MEFRQEPIENSPMAEGQAVTGGQTFEQYADEMPEMGFGVEPLTSEPGEAESVIDEPSPAEVRKLRLKMTREMKKAMNKLKKSIGTYPKMYFAAKAKKHPEWALDDDEEKLMTDSITFALDILDIDFEIEALHITLKSIWWVIAYPVTVIAGIFFVHRAAAKEAHPDDFLPKEGK